MPKIQEFRLLVATDGSPQARGAVSTALRFPWPAQARARAVVARRMGKEHSRSILLAALDRSADAAARAVQRNLRRRWPESEAVVVDTTPIVGVLGEAERFAADVIVLGWRGHGPLRRLLMGSVSRGVVRGARCTVLVVRRRSLGVRRIVIGVDGSPNAQRAVAFVLRLRAPRDGRVVLFTAVETAALPAQAMAPAAILASVAVEVRRLNADRVAAAGKRLTRIAGTLQHRGWRVRYPSSARARRCAICLPPSPKQKQT